MKFLIPISKLRFSWLTWDVRMSAHPDVRGNVSHLLPHVTCPVVPHVSCNMLCHMYHVSCNMLCMCNVSQEHK